jgi:hypothetical protein
MTILSVLHSPGLGGFLRSLRFLLSIFLENQAKAAGKRKKEMVRK